MKFSRGDSQKPENNDDCRTLAPFVMTLFDGEADELEARRARAHLLVCQTCANRWLDWNRSRDLLQSAPVPAPPPQLLWRVLMACRLNRAPHRAKSPVPADLGAQILARTTRTTPITPPISAPRRVWSPLRISMLAAPALTVPALMIWMMVLQRDVWLPAPALAPATSSSAFIEARAIPAKARAPQVSVPTRASTRPEAASAPLPPLKSAAKPVSQNATRISTQPVARAPRVEKAAPARSRLLIIEAPRAVQVRFEARPIALSQRASRLETPATSRAATSSAAPRRAAAIAPRRAFSVRLTALSGPERAPRMRAPHWRRAPRPGVEPLRVEAGSPILAPRVASQTSSASQTTSSPQVLRVSLPSATAPQSARLLAENFDMDDERVEEIRSVVDDFRATLGSDDTFGADSEIVDENTG